MISGIYVLEFPTGIYIGSSCSANDRITEHNLHLRRGRHVNPFLQNAFNKYGPPQSWIIFQCRVEDLLFYEQSAIDALHPRFNICRIAGKVTYTPEVRAKMREAWKIRRLKPMSAETRAKIGAASKGNSWRKGATDSEETRLKKSLSQRQRRVREKSENRAA